MSSVCILTSAHSPFDQRIFHKQAKTLVKSGYDVTIVAHHGQKETRDGVDVIPISPSDTISSRFVDLFRIYRVAKNTGADVYHFHDPTLLPFGAMLSIRTDAKVIYDAHEDYPESLKHYSMTPTWAVPFVERFWPTFESTLANQLDGIIGASDHISDLYREWGHNNISTVHNFPDVSNMEERNISVERTSEYVLIFTGNVDESRDLSSMIEVTAQLYKSGYDICLWLLGPVNVEGGKKELKRRLNREGHSEYIRVFGRVDHSEVYSYQRKADIGLAMMTKMADGKRHYWREIPTKMFEYMYAEIPVVATDTIGVENYLPKDCGLKVPSQHVAVQVEAIEKLINNPDLRRKMGKAGRRHVLGHLSWQSESKILLEFYESIVN